VVTFVGRLVVSYVAAEKDALMTLGWITDAEPLPLIDAEGRDIHGEAARLRALSPITRVQLPGGGTPFWVTGHAEIEKILRLDNTKVSANARLHWDDYRNGLIQPGHVAHSWAETDNMFSAYDDAHRRLRSLNSPAFSPARIDALDGPIAGLVDELLDDLAAAAGDEVDLRKHFTGPLPLRVICRLFGVPDDETLHAAYEESVAALFNTARPEAIPAAAERLAGLLADLVALKRAQPGEDLTTTLLEESLPPDDAGETTNGEQAPAQLTFAEVLATLFMHVGAGFETTTGLLDSTIVLLLSHPQYLAELRSGALTLDEVGREVLRLRPPLATRLVRAAVKDITIDTVDAEGRPAAMTIPKGAGIVFSYAGGGRDPRAYGEDADVFDPHRGDDVRLLSFGRGPHRCIGSRLAMLQMRVAVRALLERFPDMQLAVPVEELVPTESFVTDDVREVPVRLAG
jgi:2-hydroxy-5-methyl-1-naphthoate 7-hydroxylase